MGLSVRVKEYFVNEGPLYTFVAVWMLINAFLFYDTFQLYRGDKWTYLRVIVKDGLPVARGAASVLNFNCAVILIPVCRNLINAMRGTFESFRSLRRLFDKNILFHKWCAYTICLFAAIHIGAHMFNINCLAQTTNPNADFIVNDNASPETIAFTTVPGITGLLITFSLIFMVTTAVEQIRRSYFELFWYTHHLFIVFYVALAMHGYAGFVHRQINFDQVQYYDDAAYLKDHPTGQCIGIGDSGCRTNGCENLACTYLDLIASQPNLIVDSATNLLCFNNGMANTSYPDDFSANTTCCSCFTRTDKALSAEIVAGGPKTYQWIIGPLVLYLLERLYRYYKSITRKLQVLKIVRHNDQIPVMEVQMTKVKTLAGQYAFINCPDVSAFEWHPFTLTSCPRLDYISFHIRLVGDWTCQFAERCGFFRTKEEGAFTVSQLPKIALDGPFGTSSEDIFKYEVGVCVCAGIGVTPFASLLQELFLRKFSNKPSHMRTKTVYFYWICPGFESWGWFANLLIGFEQKCIANGLLDFLKIRVYSSRGWSKEDAEKIIMQDEEEGGDVVIRDSKGVGLQAKLNFGRPDWGKEFGQMAKEYPGTEIGVFFCGPKILSTTLHKKCNEYTDGRSGGTKFFYNKENF